MEDIRIYDNLLEDELRNELEEFFRKDVSWKYGAYSNTSISIAQPIPHWVKYFHIEPTNDGTPVDEVTFEEPCIQSLYNKIKEIIEPGSYLLRCYANGYTYGNYANIHTDDFRNGTTTFIFYPMKEWNVDWCGETIFWNRENREITKSVLPKSNRLLMFPSNLWHGARPVSRNCGSLRMTLMFKFITPGAIVSII